MSIKKKIKATTKNIISSVIRGQAIFINKNRIKGKVLLNVGCGRFPKKDFINLDYRWFPKIDICWNIVKKKYPLPYDSLEGIFSEHCLEHIPFESCADNIKEYFKLLKTGGTLRIAVPDGEIYADKYQQRKSDPSVKLPYSDGEETGMISINRIFRSHGHQFIYDYETMKLLLERAGFRNISKRSYLEGNDKRLLIDRPDRALESLYVEAVK